MIYLTTGANGAGKTLLTLRDVREKSLKENRPVFYNGRFEMIADFGWQKIDAREWMACPDGAIFLFDECHNDFPVRRGTGDAPKYVTELGEHRRRGFDFFLISQHPNNIDAFIRRLIGPPGWHRHLKRASGAPLVSVLTWGAVNENCQKVGSGESGSTVMVPFPKEVYTWYKSAELHTAVLKIPFQVKILAAALLLVPVLGYFGWQAFQNHQMKNVNAAALAKADPKGGAPVPLSSNVANSSASPLTPAEYAASYRPRVAGLGYTAPRYDELTKAQRVPLVAACVQSGKRCKCYSQQATPLDVPYSMCVQFVENGAFDDFSPLPEPPPRTVSGEASPSRRTVSQPDKPSLVSPVLSTLPLSSS